MGRINKKTAALVAGLLLGCILFFSPSLAYAGLSVSVADGTWAIGDIKAEATTSTTGNKWTITGQTDANSVEDILIKVEDTTSPPPTNYWTPSTSADNTVTTNQFVLREDSSSGLLIKGTDVTLKSSLTDSSNTYGLDLWFKAPPSGSDEGAHTLTVTLTATAFEACGTCKTATDPGGCVNKAEGFYVDLCTECDALGAERALADDAACGTISCDDWHHQVGSDSATGTNYCYDSPNITTNRCEGIRDCKDANTADCGSADDTNELSCGTCKYVDGCSGTTDGYCSNYGTSTTCSALQDCDYLNYYYQSPSGNSPTGTDKCYHRNYVDRYRYCNAAGSCAALSCSSYANNYQYECGTCKYIASSTCTGGTRGSCTNYGTVACGITHCRCSGGSCNYCPATTAVNQGCYSCGGGDSRTCAQWCSAQGYASCRDVRWFFDYNCHDSCTPYRGCDRTGQNSCAQSTIKSYYCRCWDWNYD